MMETINNFAGYLENVSIFSYPISLFLGFLAGMGAITCFLPIIPMVMGFTAGKELTRKRMLLIPLYIMFGSIIVLGILGIIISFVGLSFQKQLGPYWPYLIGIVCVVVGLVELRIIKTRSFNIPKFNCKGFFSPMLFGMAVGGTIGIGSSCCVPTLPIVLTYAGIQGNPIHGGMVLTMFAIGQSIPVFAIGFFSNALSGVTVRWSSYVHRIAGIVLVVVGGYLITGQFYTTRIPDAVQSTGLMSLATAKELDSSLPSSEAQNLSWRDMLTKCSKENKFAFLLVDEGKTSDGQVIRKMLQKVVDGHQNEVSISEVDYSKDQNIFDNYFNLKLKALPVVFAIAPNNAITGIFDKSINEETAEQSLVSAAEADLILSLQKNQVIFLCLYKNQSDEFKKVKDELGAIEQLFNGVGVARYLNTNDTSVKSFIKKLPQPDPQPDPHAD